MPGWRGGLLRFLSQRVEDLFQLQQPFEWIVPCGIDAARMTSVAAELGRLVDFYAFTDAVESAFAAELGREVEPASVAALPRG